MSAPIGAVVNDLVHLLDNAIPCVFISWYTGIGCITTYLCCERALHHPPFDSLTVSMIVFYYRQRRAWKDCTYRLILFAEMGLLLSSVPL